MYEIFFLQFRASVSIDFHFKDLFKSVKEYLQKAANIAKQKLEEAEQKVRDSKSALTNARGKMQGWRNKLDEYKNWLQRKSDEIEEAKKKLQNDCKKECGKGNFYKIRTESSFSVHFHFIFISFSFYELPYSFAGSQSGLPLKTYKSNKRSLNTYFEKNFKLNILFTLEMRNLPNRRNRRNYFKV